MKIGTVISRLATLATVCAIHSLALAEDVPTGPIWSNDDAQIICPCICAGLVWDGNWQTTEPGRMSVCRTTTGNDFEVGPIWNNDDAQSKCPNGLARVEWSGEWRTTVPGKTSVCDCDSPFEE